MTGDSAIATATIERDIVIDAPVDVVWRTITEPDQIVQWFADRVDVEARPGGDGLLTFHDPAQDQLVEAPIVVEAVDEPHQFSFRWGHPSGERPVAGNSMLVEFTLVVEGQDRTRLRVVETGLELLDWPAEQKTAYADDHRGGWEHHLGRLQDLFSGRSDG